MSTEPIAARDDAGQEMASPCWHGLDRSDVAAALDVPLSGLDDREAAERLARFGPNRIEPPAPVSRWTLIVRQFKSPLIYVLLVAGGIALLLGELTDAVFIAAVLLLNAAIGFANEYRADREVTALATLVTQSSRVHRDGRVLEIDSAEVVPGDLLVLEGGVRVGADVRLVEEHDLRVDESLLSGESLAVEKNAALLLPPETPLAERLNMAFAGSMAVAGRGLGLVVATGTATELGTIAGDLVAVPREPPPLLRRMERFARRVGIAAIGLCALLVAVGVLRGQPLEEVLLGAIALVVSAIPEGLPVALTVALAVAVSRMARRGVVVRHLPAVEALGSCGVIATDKTGTLTRNQLTVQRIVTGERTFEVTGVGYEPTGEVLVDGHRTVLPEEQILFRIARASCLANEASLTSSRREGDGWDWSGDPTDIALLSFAIKADLDPVAMVERHEPVAVIPFESEYRFMASYHASGERGLVCVKGAPEQIVEMCDHEAAGPDGEARPIDRAAALDLAEQVMREGYRVLAVADRTTPEPASRERPAPMPSGLTFLGLVAMTDPPRERVAGALEACHRSGIRVIMVTGDHATTARSIAERIGLARPDADVLSGDELDRLSDDELDARMGSTRVVARATPAQKLRVVESCQRLGDFVAVTGDGVNDAPALRRANLGVAMGREGTDVAREAADLVITNDDFSTIVDGVEQGRFAYDNVRKVTYLLVSTGAGEVLTVTTALALGLPIPFTAVQLLWLNLVTNGIQDVALAFEPGEPGALDAPPRPPRQGLFDRLMLERTLLAGAVFGFVGVWCFAQWLAEGRSVAEARNLLVQLYVLFEILHIGNSRSERTSLFRLHPFGNPFLLLGTLAALAVHVAALYTPMMQTVLDVAPVTLADLLRLLGHAGLIIVVMEIHKAWRQRWPIRSATRR